MKRRLAVVDPVLAIQGDQHVVVDRGEIAGLNGNPARDRRPGRRREEVLARNRREKRLDARLVDACRAGDALGVVPAEPVE
jgi:hypothetical protein